MSNRHRIAANTLAQIVGKLISTTTTLVTTYLLGRYLGVEFYGNITKVVATSTLLFMALDFGLNPIVIKAIKQKPENLNHFFRTLLGLRLLISVGVYVAIILPLLLSPTSPKEGYTSLVKMNIALFALQYFAQVVILSTSAVFQLHLQYARVVIASSLGNLLQLALIGAVIHHQPTLTHITLISLLGLFTTAIVAHILVRPYVSSLLPQFSWATSKKLLLAASPLGIALIFNLFANRLDMVMLTLWRSSSEVGYYGLVRRIFDGILVIPSFFMNAVYPILIEKTVTHRHRLPALIKEAAVILVISGIIVGTGTFLAAPIVMFIRPEFAPAVNALKIMALFLPIFFLTNLLMWAVIALGHPLTLIKAYLTAFIINLVLNSFAIPRYGYLAPPMTTGITEIAVLVFLIGPVLKSLHRPAPKLPPG